MGHLRCSADYCRAFGSATGVRTPARTGEQEPRRARGARDAGGLRELVGRAAHLLAVAAERSDPELTRSIATSLLMEVRSSAEVVRDPRERVVLLAAVDELLGHGPALDRLSGATRVSE